MVGYQFLSLISLVTFTFGALAFSVLALSYWSQWRLRLPRGGDLVFPAFTLACAGAFLANLLLRIVAAGLEDSALGIALSAVLDLATGMVSPLLFHVVYREEAPGLRGRPVWRWALSLFYGGSFVSALAKGLADANLLGESWSDRLESAAAFRLAAAGCLGLLCLLLSRRPATAAQRRHRWWNRVLFGLTLTAAIINLAQAPPIWGLLPDYLLLIFFCVTLYYQQRLVFFDLLIKRGAFFAVALAGSTIFFATTPSILAKLPADWSRPWIAALLLTPLWLLAPWIYGKLALVIDRVCLDRRYSAAEAERLFVRAIQLASGEEELRARAAAGLADIFQAAANVRFDAAPSVSTAGSLSTPIEQQGATIGWLVLAERRNSLPYLSDDHRLLQSLARTLGVTLENVRFREGQQQQEERERQLRLLASRAELRALRAQINPHFLFNALNAIAGLIPDQPLLADETVEQLAQVFRYTLRKSEKEWARLDEEVEFVAAYLRVEQARFGQRLRVEVEVDPAAKTIPVPAMSIQPLVENAIKHGVAAVEGPGVVGLTACLGPDGLRIEVSDNGPGFPAEFSLASPATAGGGYGLRNVSDRLRGYYGELAQLGWEHGNGLTRVFVQIPHPAPELMGRNPSDAGTDCRR